LIAVGVPPEGQVGQHGQPAVVLGGGEWAAVLVGGEVAHAGQVQRAIAVLGGGHRRPHRGLDDELDVGIDRFEGGVEVGDEAVGLFVAPGDEGQPGRVVPIGGVGRLR